MLKRYIDITSKSCNLQSIVDKWLNCEDLINLPDDVLSASYLYIPGTQDSKPDLESIYPGRFFSKVWLIKVPDLVDNDVLTCDILEERSDEISPGDSVLIYTGWKKQMAENVHYIDKAPVLGNDLAEWLIRKEIGTLITDTPLLANRHYIPEFMDVYNLLSQSGIIIFSNASNLGVLNDSKKDLVVMPLKISGTNFTPARAIVIQEQ